MSNRNGLGPDNQGPMTGRGMGDCKNNDQQTTRGQARAFGKGRGQGCQSRGQGRRNNGGRGRRCQGRS